MADTDSSFNNLELPANSNTLNLSSGRRFPISLRIIFFAFGIGSTVNRLLIEGIAHAGQGESFVVTQPEEADARADQFREYVQNPLLTNIKISYKGFEAYDVTPAQVPDVFAQRPVLLYGKWKGEPQGSISVSGLTGKGKWDGNLSITKNKSSKKNSAIK